MANTSVPVSLQEQLGKLQQQYAERLPERLSEIEGTWQALLATPWDAALCARLQRHMHGLAGSGASFGFTTLSTTARSLELLLGAIIDQATPPTIEQRMQIDALIAAVRQDGAQPDSATPSRAHPLVRPRPLNDQNYQVFVLDRDRHTVDDLAEQITYYGYTVHTFRDPAELRGAMEHTAPAAIMLEHSVTHHHNTDVAILMEELRAASIPLIFLSARSDLAARLAAVRAGGSAYFTKPVSVGGLIDTLDTLTMQRVPELFRILVIDDEPTLAEYYATVLHQAGMTTEVVTDPLQAFEQLEAFHPDLILMDMYMPGCTGLELAAVIRQQVAYVSVPIVFLSAETNPDRQWAAMHLGGDDFLTKPIQPAHLVSAVTSRVQRARTLRALMTRDSLTGLLNHTSTRERLGVEAARAQREGLSLSFAMIDIDHFKSVNDTYGHPAGDRVIKSLARLLQQRLRKMDVIGRYGGEEFAIVLQNIDVHSGQRLLDEIRDRFAHIRHAIGNKEVYVTFSCGLASFPTYEDATMLTQAADQALYQAKRGGRNQVLVAHS